MTFNPNIHHRRSIRLQDYDYTHTGAYFITICVQNHECLLGNIGNGVMTMNDAGRMVETVWRGLPCRFPLVELDAFVVIPNHVHGIVSIYDDIGPPSSVPNGSDHLGAAMPGGPMLGGPRPGGPRPAPTTLGTIVCAFKSIAAIQVNRLLSRTALPFWQRNYFERVIRNNSELNEICKYIGNNPLKWSINEHLESSDIPTLG